MNEQPTPTPDDDVEGHAIRSGRRPATTDGVDDVEGHMPFSKRHAFASDESADGSDDVEGHMPRVRFTPSDEDGDDDVEGHMPRVRI